MTNETSPSSTVATTEHIDLFQQLEERFDSLMEYIGLLKKENESLADKLHIQEKTVADLTQEMESLREANGKQNQRVAILLERIDDAMK